MSASYCANQKKSVPSPGSAWANQEISVKLISAILSAPQEWHFLRSRYLNETPVPAGRYGMAAPWYFPLLPSYWIEYNSYLPFWDEKRRGLLFSKLMLRKEVTLPNKICMWILDGVAIIAYISGKQSQIFKGAPYTENTIDPYFEAQEELKAGTHINGDLALKLYLFLLFVVESQ